jgi:hypothetical protein
MERGNRIRWAAKESYQISEIRYQRSDISDQEEEIEEDAAAGPE